MRRLLLLAALGLCGAASKAPAIAPLGAPSLTFPVSCKIGETCWIQHYVDRDAGPGERDYTCGTLSYNDHRGTDIRVVDLAAQRAGVAVVAAAPGTVSRFRDGVDDVSVRARGFKAVQDRECGNGIVIVHGGGWETYYCHLAKGSLEVHPGQKVTAGAQIARIGLSGLTEFPHLHFSLRRAGVEVDPFAPERAVGRSCGSGRSLWIKTPPYKPRAVISAGFSEVALSDREIESGGITPPKADSPLLAAYVRVIGLKKGDVQDMIMTGPGGVILAKAAPDTLAANQDQGFRLVGKRRPSAGVFPSGVYSMIYTVTRDGRMVLSRRVSITL